MEHLEDADPELRHSKRVNTVLQDAMFLQAHLEVPYQTLLKSELFPHMLYNHEQVVSPSEWSQGLNLFLEWALRWRVSLCRSISLSRCSRGKSSVAPRQCLWLFHNKLTLNWRRFVLLTSDGRNLKLSGVKSGRRGATLCPVMRVMIKGATDHYLPFLRRFQ